MTRAEAERYAELAHAEVFHGVLPGQA